MKHETIRTDKIPARPDASPRLELVGFLAPVKLVPGQKLPEELIVVPWGRTETRRGPVICDERTLAVFDAHQAANRRDHVMGDINHASMPGKVPVGTPVLKMCKARARVERGVGVIARMDYYTAEGEQYVGGGHYPDVSPAIERDEQGVVHGLHSFAFVEHGEMQADSLEIFSAESAPTNQPNPKKPDTMDYKKLLCAAYGLPETATDEELAAAIAERDKPAEGMSAAAGVPLLKKKERPDIELTAFAAEMKGLRTEVAAMRAEAGEAKVDALISVAVQAGKQVKLDRPTLVGMGAEAAGKYLDSLDAGVVPVSGQNQNATAAAGKTSETEGFTAEEEAQMRANGVDPEKVKVTLASL